MQNISFDENCFHDNLIHGISFVTENFRSDLCLDIDYIIQWPQCIGAEDDEPLFIVSKALLSFHDLTDLKVNMDWGASGFSTSVTGFFIERIDQEKIDTPLLFENYYKWDIVICDHRSKLSFGASGMSLDLIGGAMSVNRQYLTENERRGMISGDESGGG